MKLNDKIEPVNDSTEKPLQPDTAKTIKDILTSPEVLQALASIPQQNSVRPKQSSRFSNFSYYRKEYGLEMKIVLDGMIERRADVEWSYSEYPKYKKNTLYTRINQSINFVLHHLDPDGRYAKVMESLVIDTTLSPTGIRLMWVREKGDGKGFLPREVKKEERVQLHREQIEAFLNDAETQILHLKKLHLSGEEVETIKQSLAELEGKSIWGLITEHEIKIIKIAHNK